MPRHFKERLDYFPLDCDFFHDYKIFATYRHCGSDAIALYLLILCRCYSDKGYYLIWDKDTEFMLCYDLPQMDEKRLRELLKELFRAGLFDLNLWNKYHIITSVRIQRTYLWAIYERAKKAKQRGKIISFDANIWLLSFEETEDRLCTIDFSDPVPPHTAEYSKHFPSVE